MASVTTKQDTSTPIPSLTADEITRTRRLLVEAGLPTDATRFAYAGLLEPDMADVWADFAGGLDVDRCVRAVLLDIADGTSLDCATDLTSDTVAMADPRG